MRAAVTSDDWSAYLSDPAWLPHAYDPARDALTFAHVPREAQRRITFLDPRFIPRSAESHAVALTDLPPARVRAASGPLRFIFHTGFCCSTLLTRALDMPGVSMGLKEPAVLASFAEYWSGTRRTAGAFEALIVTLDLLSRPFGPGETQIVKPSTVANHIIPQLLHARRDAKAIVLFSSLDSFLRAIARRGQEGRIFARQLFRQFAPVIPLDSGFSDEDALLQADLQVAAQAWLMQAAFMETIARRFGVDHVRVLSKETLLARPADTLHQVGRFFGADISEPRAAEIAAGPVFREHAKELGRPFDTAAAQAQHDEAGAAHRDELVTALSWARTLAARCNAPLVLQETLFA